MGTGKLKKLLLLLLLLLLGVVVVVVVVAAPPPPRACTLLKMEYKFPEEAASSCSNLNVAIAARTKQAWVKVAIPQECYVLIYWNIMSLLLDAGSRNASARTYYFGRSSFHLRTLFAPRFCATSTRCLCD